MKIALPRHAALPTVERLKLPLAVPIVAYYLLLAVVAAVPAFLH
jgi:hypothetical protein